MWLIKKKKKEKKENEKYEYKKCIYRCNNSTSCENICVKNEIWVIGIINFFWLYLTALQIYSN